MRVGEFLMHPSYVTLPLHATTLEAAAMYALSPSAAAAAALPSVTAASSASTTT